jgi:putative spermidine/putrescine transport system substrate-binding protein
MSRANSNAVRSTLLAVVALLLLACAPVAPAAPAANTPAGDAAITEVASDVTPEMAELIAAAQEEGMLTTIALPHDWCNYGEMIETFKTKYGIAVNELDPNAGSNDELEAIKANKGNKGPQAPDVVDVGLSFGPQAKDEGLLVPYKVATWDSIPDDAKDPEGYWWGDYYGVLTFEVNTDVVKNPPQDWADLLKPEYKNQIALAGDPRSSNQAIQTVFAAALANGGSLDNAQPGLDFFKQVVAAGNFVPTIAKPGTIAQGETPITIRWNYNALVNKDNLAGNPEIEVIVPKTGRFAGVYVQGISAYAPHPNAAKLWQEFLYSDEGQLIWMKGYCYPIRYEDLLANDKIPQDLLDKLPDVSGAVFPSLEQLDAAKALITEQWDAVVGVDVVE